MKLAEILSPSFRSTARSLGLKAEVYNHRLMVISPMWRKALSTESAFCQALVANGLLSQEQMQHAARRYRLGCSRKGGVIFWQIDHKERIHDGKLMYYQQDCHRDKHHHPTWVSTLLHYRYQRLLRRCHAPQAQPHTSSHCLFGLHLLTPTDKVAVVESEKTALILSELYPAYTWLATGGLGEVQPAKFRPLRGREVVLFPDTDPEGIAYRRWREAAENVGREPWWDGSPPIYVSDLLERMATEDQKRRKIDLADYYFETLSTPAGHPQASA